MEELTAAVLNARHGNIILPYAEIKVPGGWIGIVERMLMRIRDLPTEIRAFLMVDTIRITETGLLDVQLIGNTALMPPGGWDTVAGIIADARNEAAWTCVNSHEQRPAWIVHPAKGWPRPLCRECQVDFGVSGGVGNA